MDHPRLAVLNDTHIGALRSAGTTPRTAYDLRRYLLSEFGRQLDDIDCDLLINGDLFDKEMIPLSDLLQAYKLLLNWLAKGHKLWLSPGNHDLSKTSTTMSSFQLLGQLLTQEGLECEYISDLKEIYPGYWVLPHLPNQDLLNDRLSKVPECQALFVHCNYDNNFAAQSDQSLNISRDQAEACKAQFIIFGHEHQTRTAMDGKVVIPGNQVPSSVSDCLNCVENTKFMVTMELGVPVMRPVLELPFERLHWDDLKPEGNPLFIRVEGSAETVEGAAVVQAISRFRAKSQALVITNAVKIASDEGKMAEFADSLESVQAFDVLAALLELLTPEEQEVVKELANV